MPKRNAKLEALAMKKGKKEEHTLSNEHLTSELNRKFITKTGAKPSFYSSRCQLPGCGQSINVGAEIIGVELWDGDRARCDTKADGKLYWICAAHDDAEDIADEEDDEEEMDDFIDDNDEASTSQRRSRIKDNDPSSSSEDGEDDTDVETEEKENVLPMKKARRPIKAIESESEQEQDIDNPLLDTSFQSEPDSFSTEESKQNMPTKKSKRRIISSDNDSDAEESEVRAAVVDLDETESSRQSSSGSDTKENMLHELDMAAIKDVLSRKTANDKKNKKKYHQELGKRQLAVHTLSNRSLRVDPERRYERNIRSSQADSGLKQERGIVSSNDPEWRECNFKRIKIPNITERQITNITERKITQLFRKKKKRKMKDF